MGRRGGQAGERSAEPASRLLGPALQACPGSRRRVPGALSTPATPAACLPARRARAPSAWLARCVRRACGGRMCWLAASGPGRRRGWGFAPQPPSMRPLRWTWRRMWRAQVGGWHRGGTCTHASCVRRLGWPAGGTGWQAGCGAGRPPARRCLHASWAGRAGRRGPPPLLPPRLGCSAPTDPSPPASVLPCPAVAEQAASQLSPLREPKNAAVAAAALGGLGYVAANFHTTLQFLGVVSQLPGGRAGWGPWGRQQRGGMGGAWHSWERRRMPRQCLGASQGGSQANQVVGGERLVPAAGGKADSVASSAA